MIDSRLRKYVHCYANSLIDEEHEPKGNMMSWRKGCIISALYCKMQDQFNTFSIYNIKLQRLCN